jgi:hypothetical protein
LTKAIEDL